MATWDSLRNLWVQYCNKMVRLVKLSSSGTMLLKTRSSTQALETSLRCIRVCRTHFDKVEFADSTHVCILQDSPEVSLQFLSPDQSRIGGI